MALECPLTIACCTHDNLDEDRASSLYSIETSCTKQQQQQQQQQRHGSNNNDTTNDKLTDGITYRLKCQLEEA